MEVQGEGWTWDSSAGRTCGWRGGSDGRGGVRVKARR